MQLPYVEPSSGKHAAELTREEIRKQAIALAVNGGRILASWGTHRRGLYEHLRYRVTEEAA